MAFTLRQVLRCGYLLGLSLLDVCCRTLLRLGETIGAAEIDRATEELPFDVFVLNLIAGNGAGIDAVAFAKKFSLGGLRRLSLGFVVSLLVVFAVREGL